MSDLSSLLRVIGDDTAFVVLTEEALHSVDMKPLSEWILRQASWSDMPFLVLTKRGGGSERNPAAGRLSGILGNVSFIERPFHATSFISVAQTAMRGRRRQYEARARIEELREQERRLQTALEAGRLGAWELDLVTYELSTSPICKAIFGRLPNEPFAYPRLQASIHPDDLKGMHEALAATIETGVGFAAEYRVIWPDRSIHWVENRAQLLRNRIGVAVKLVGVSVDFTERRQILEQQRHLNELLEERVAARTAELEAAHEIVLAEAAQRQKAEEQLRQIQKLEAIGQLTGGVAHDFNNLLMVVLGNLELIRKAVTNEARLVRLVDGALQAAKRGASLTQRLLAFARRQDLQVKAVDLRKLVTDMEDLLRRSIGPMIILDKEMPENLPHVLADANQLELALLNLAVNARDAMLEGGSLKIALAEINVAPGDKELSAGRYVLLSVADNGKGMDEDTLAKAVEPFFSTKELGKGTGLGLSMIHGLALQLGGSFSLESTLGSGTTAQLLIPAVEGDVVQVDVKGSSPVIMPDKQPKRILLVDDDILIAMSSADMVTDLGHEVVEAHSGAEALEILGSDQQFDLLITDYSMPGMNGADLVHAARRLVPDLPVLLASGYADLPTGVQVDAVRLGKPYTQDQLAHEICSALQA